MLALDHVLAAVRGGGYISTFKAIPVLLLLMLWGRLVAWADADAFAAHMPRVKLNIVNVIGMAVAFALFFLMPTFILSFLILLIVMGAEAGVYLSLRSKAVGLKDLDKEFKNWISQFTGGVKTTGETKVAAGQLSLMGKDGKPLPVPDKESPDRPAYDAIQQAFTGPITREAQQIDVAPEGDGMGIKYTVDNFVHRGGSIDRAVGAAAISYLKWAAGLNVEDRRKPQTGNMKVALDKAKHELKLQTAGTTAGEYLRVIVDPKIRHAYKLGELGFSESQKKLVDEMIKDRKGIVLLSAPKGHGLTSLFYTILRSHDAFIEHAQTIERDQEQDLEGITQNKLAANAAAGEEYKMVDWAISQEPHVLGISKIEDPKSAVALIDFAKTGQRVYVCLRANSTFEALEQWKRMVGDSAAASEALRMVINGRVLRKLCAACKEGFTPDPVTLKKLNLSGDKVSTLYKAREQPLRDAKGNPVTCEFCHDIRFKGRSGVFEILQVDDEMRQTLDANKPLPQAFRKQRGKYLQEEALLVVEKGDTSVQEVLRILKPAAETAQAAPAAAARAPAAAAPTRNR